MGDLPGAIYRSLERKNLPNTAVLKNTIIFPDKLGDNQPK